ncbi:hypothetical protein SAMN05428959_102938 [Duganella sp. CF517]|uniref:hypothetical protein n=1 Tax=Duganella sp. CF517 TaxID=1881038 RepID=UPI0008D30CA8|nr:hypothetical protein [Duganella sp. CF517]SEN69368.1 hypothetical protein SAMN05428959_102938 [Duganella sp. CF517]
MTTDIPDTPPQDAALAFWQQRIKASRWLITKTIGLGACAAVLGVLGQGWLEHAAPLFPVISQNYGIWQAAYLLSLLIIFCIWVAAMRQKMGLLANSKQGFQVQLRIDEHNERRAQRALEARERRKKLEEDRDPVLFFKSAARSKKFDY